MKRRGMAYTLFTISVVVFMLFYLVQVTYYRGSYVENELSLGYAGYSLKQIVHSFEGDLPRSMDVALKRALLELINNETYEGKYYENAEEILHSLAYYGKYESLGDNFLSNSSVQDWIRKFNILTSFSNVEVNVSLYNYSLYLSYYDVLSYCYNVSYVVLDPLNEQWYNKTKTLCTHSLIENFEDPFITISSYENVISSFKVCNSLDGVGEGEFYGIAFKPTTYNLSSFSSRDKYVLVVENLGDYSSYDGFAGYVLVNNTTLPSTNYIYGINIESIMNNSLIAVSSDKAWITNTSKDGFSTTCYFAWSDGMNFLERLKGVDLNSSLYDVATFVDTDPLPPELRTIEDFALDIELWK